MKNYKMELAYDGKRYKGFRKVKGDEDKTIQGKLENILKKLYEEDIEVIGAVNTDASVHALFQVVNFTAPHGKFSEGKLLNYMETYLPDDIIILSVNSADERFHARYNVSKIKYEYRLWKSNAPHRPLFERSRVKLMEKALNITVMEEAASRMIGEKDFKAFSTKSKVKSSVKTVYDLTIRETEYEVIISITANSFLLNMERIIIGTLIQVGLYEKDIESIDKAFKSLNDKYVGHKAMAGALCLVDVSYE
jgi:tRNA pseudouridine38-40 synthase